MTAVRYHAEELERTDTAIRYRFEFPAESALFDGHFPDNPILPGVAQVQICTEVLGRSLDRPILVEELGSVRFRKPLTPESPCELTVQLPDAEGHVEFEYRTGEALVADGKMRITMEQQDG